MHLSHDSHRRLIDRTLKGRDARALAEHLRKPCDECETYLVERRVADRFDGAVDAALLPLPPPTAAAAGNDLEYARIERALRASPPRRRWTTAVAAAAVVTVAGLAGLLLAPPERPAWDGAKGQVAQAVPLRLRFLVLTPATGGPPALERGLSGQEVPSAASLQFQVELGRPANLLLARVGRGGAPEVFLATRLAAGRHVVTLDGQPAAYPLASLSGPQRFLALASEARLGPDDAARAAKAAHADTLGTVARRDDGIPISLDQVEVRVRP
jgi:hypothetical protein